MDPACMLHAGQSSVAQRPIIGASAAPAIQAGTALCLDRPLSKFAIHPPVHLSSHTKAKLEGRLTDPSLFHPRLSVRFAIRRVVDTLIPLLGPG